MADRTIELLDAHLDSDFRVMPLAPHGVAREQVEAMGARLGVRFPTELVDHLAGRFPGIFIEANEDVWPRPGAFDVGPLASFLYAVHTYTAAPESEPWMRLDRAAEEFRAQTGLEAAPVLKVAGGADVYCVDASGALLYFRHDTYRLEPVEGDFWSLFDRELAALRARKDAQKAGRGVADSAR